MTRPFTPSPGSSTEFLDIYRAYMLELFFLANKANMCSPPVPYMELKELVNRSGETKFARQDKTILSTNKFHLHCFWISTQNKLTYAFADFYMGRPVLVSFQKRGKLSYRRKPLCKKARTNDSEQKNSIWNPEANAFTTLVTCSIIFTIGLKKSSGHFTEPNRPTDCIKLIGDRSLIISYT